MLPIYNFSLFIYRLFISLYALCYPKAKLWQDGRKDWRKNLKAQAISSDTFYWVHCASLGEFEQGRPIIEGIKKRNPDVKIVLSFFSPSGYEVRKDYPLADIVCYLPLDSKKNASEFLDIINPSLAIFIKYDIWFHYINELKKRNIPSYLVSALFQKNQIYFKPLIGRFFRRILDSMSEVFVQNKSSLDLLATHDIYNVSVSGDTRFDRVFQNAQSKKIFEKLSFVKPKSTLIAGSAWPKDNRILENYWKDRRDKLDLMIIAPHEINSIDIMQDSYLYSSILSDENTDKSILIIDNIGMLSSLYAYGDYAYIGGGFGAGIHNILEAAVWGVPIFFGPNYKRFKEAQDLVDIGGAMVINSASELREKIFELDNDVKAYDKISQLNKNYIIENRGATALVLDRILSK